MKQPPVPARALIALLLSLALAGCSSFSLPSLGGGDDDLGASRGERPGDIYAQIGQAYLDEGQPAVALRKLRRGLEIDPDNARIHAVLGILYQRLEEHERAAEHLRQAAELEPSNPWFRNAWGSFLCQRGQFAEADEQFRLALANPLYDRAWQASTNAGLCALRAGQTEAGEAYLRRALSSNPAIPQALGRMAQIEFERGDPIAAAAYLERYARVAPHSPDTLLLGARIAQAQGDAEALGRYREQLTRRFPDVPETKTAKELELQ